MSIKLNNAIAFNVYSKYAESTTNLQKSMSRLASGEKSVEDDGAGVAISERMRSQARSTAMARQNTEGALSVLQTADSWLQRINNMLARMHELSVEANDGTKTDTDRSNITAEFDALQSEIKRITEGDAGQDNAAAKYNTRNLLNGTFSMVGSTVIGVQVGADAGQTIGIQISSFSVAAAGDFSIANLSLSTPADAAVAISNLQTAVNMVASERATVGGQQNRFSHTRASLLAYEDNIRAAESKIRDVDMARETSEMAKQQILSPVGTAMLAQANQLPGAVMQLLG